MAITRRPHPIRKLRDRSSGAMSLAPGRQLLSVRAVARMLAVSRPTVYAMIRRGELRVLYVGRNARLSEPEVRAYVRLHSQWVVRRRLQRKKRGARGGRR